MGGKEAKEHIEDILKRAKAREALREANRNEVAQSTPVAEPVPVGQKIPKAKPGPVGKRILLAEEDSPGTDVLEELEDDDACIGNLAAHAGATITSMADHKGQRDKLKFRLAVAAPFRNETSRLSSSVLRQNCS